jgi:outer membrane protein assembly factor BamD (BamD/ComL family)
MQGAGDCAGLEDAAMAVTQANARAELLLAAGTCKQAAGDPESALALFDRILAEHRESPSAVAAMFERGVACEATGRPGTAVGAFATYRREYPSAPRVAEALFRLCRLHIGGRRFEQAIACVRRFRDRYPSDEHVDQTHYLEGMALKEQTETLVQAAESFARYAAGSDTEHLDDALYWRASCLREAKDAGQADAARAYLQRLPAGKHAAEVRGWLGGG